MPEFTLKTILSTFSDKKGKKLTILNGAPVGGISSKLIILLFILLPFIEYFAIFNPYVFNVLGLVTAIVTYIVFLSIVMVIIFVTILKVKQNIIKKITPSWEYYFKDVELKMVLSSGITPYNKFFDYYSKLVLEDLSDELLHTKLQEAFAQMQEDNQELLIAIKKDNQNI